MLKRVVQAAEVVALAAALVFVVALFRGGDEPAAPPTTGGETAAADGAALYRARCAGCHGAEGGGAVGPQLSEGKVVEEYPDIADQIAVVTDGRGGMPSFASRLTAEEIEAVVTFTREQL